MGQVYWFCCKLVGLTHASVASWDILNVLTSGFWVLLESRELVLAESPKPHDLPLHLVKGKGISTFLAFVTSRGRAEL